jgi:hypothetical protein
VKISRKQAKLIIADAQAYLDEIESHIANIVPDVENIEMGMVICHGDDPSDVASQAVQHIGWHVRRKVLAELGQAQRGDRMLRKDAKPHEPQEPMTPGQIEDALEQSYARIMAGRDRR